jgi:ABC-type bacteriocin/lantibiotic exporter with double-glycine peptidase domain
MKRRFFVPETIQASAMDCGPAALRTLLEGHGINASYGRLREACQTGIDGTSIDQIEIAAREMGLDAEQIMLPLDHVLLPEAYALPAMVVMRQPTGYTHFVVAWRMVGDWVQIMDPGAGRRWVRRDAFLAEVHKHRQPVPIEAWNEWSRSEAFLTPLRARMRAIGGEDEGLIAHVDLARVDAAVRLVKKFVDCGAVRVGEGAVKLSAKIARTDDPIPDQYSFANAETSETIVLQGAVLLRVRGRLPSVSPPASRELAAALAEKPAQPLRDLARITLSAGRVGPAVIGFALAAAAAGTAIEALLFRGFFDLDHDLVVRGQRLGALAAMLVLSTIVLALEFSAAKGALRLGRKLENIIRSRFLAKLPRLGDRYFQSRPISDMASRSHQVHQLRKAPELAAAFARVAFEIMFTVAGIVWLYPGALWPALVLMILCIGIPLIFQPALSERDLRMRSHSGALSQYYLDSLLGLSAIRAHGAERTMRRRQETSLAEWARSGWSLQKLVTAVEGIQLSAALAATAWIVWRKLSPGAEPAGLLLLVYWILNLPSLGQDAASIVFQYPVLRSTALRLLEPLQAPDEESPSVALSRLQEVPLSTRNRSKDQLPAKVPAPHLKLAEGVEIELERVTVRAAGNVILDNVSVRIGVGSHVAIVGASGAGKSSLAGLLLGWHRAEAGSVQVNGRQLDPSMLAWLRERTAWIDPQVHIWNKSMLENLTYGVTSGTTGTVAVAETLHDADLHSVLEKMPNGLQTALGEGGTLVSGGEGQRVRIGRALARENAGLVILDEPARGLDADRRRGFLELARERWRGATMLAITHDMRDTLDFDHVLVIDGGRIVEDGTPAKLAADPTSKYRRLIDIEDELKRGLWASRKWRRMTMRDGHLSEAEKRGMHVIAC